MYSYEKLQSSNRLGPVIDLQALAPIDPSLSSTSKALIDTGATITCVPEKIILDLGKRNLASTTKPVSGAFEKAKARTEREAYVINIKLGNCLFENMEVIVLPPGKEFALIGRDILNKYKITFDGPNETWTVSADCGQASSSPHS